MVSRFDVLQYHWLGREEGYTALEHEVIFRDLCSGCGVCEAVCPDDVIQVGEFPKLVGECTNCGYCLIQCPRSFFSPSTAEEKLFGGVAEGLLGHVEAMVAARALDEELARAAQDGGFVTALVKYLLENRLIDGAVVSGIDDSAPWKPLPKLVTSPGELLGTGGTRYSNSANLRVLKEAGKLGLKELALVGVPCQIEGYRKIQSYPLEDVELDRVRFAIALFCKGNFLYEGLMRELLEKKHGISLEEMRKIDIKGKNVVVTLGEEEVLVPLSEAHEHLREGCRVCYDFTSRLSDFSVGSVGSPRGYSTVLARTRAAAEVLDRMEAEGVIEVKELLPGKQGVEMIERLQKLKERDARRHARQKVMEALPLPFRHLKF